jgi:hypothetical protein
MSIFQKVWVHITITCNILHIFHTYYHYFRYKII